MARITKQKQIDELGQQLAWYRLALNEIAGFEFPQDGDHEWSKSAGRVARHIAQSAIDGESWKTNTPDFKAFSQAMVSSQLH